MAPVFRSHFFKNLNIPGYTLGKTERLKSRKLIDKIFSEGKAVSIFPFRMLFLTNESDLTLIQAGFAVSSRHFKKAVDRNRIKRLTREAYRLQKSMLEKQLEKSEKKLVLFFIYTGRELPAFEHVFEKMGIILQRLMQILNENNTPNS